MLDSPQDYFYTENLSSILIDGGVLTHREDNNQLRGEDFAFMKESYKQQQNVFNGSKILGREDTGPRAAVSKYWNVLSSDISKVHFNPKIDHQQVNDVYSSQSSIIVPTAMQLSGYVNSRPEDYMKRCFINVAGLQNKYVQVAGEITQVMMTQLYALLPTNKTQTALNNVSKQAKDYLDRRDIQNLLRNQQQMQSPTLWVKSEFQYSNAYPRTMPYFCDPAQMEFENISGGMTREGAERRLVTDYEFCLRVGDTEFQRAFQEMDVGGAGWFLAPRRQIFIAPTAYDVPEQMYSARYKVYLYGSLTYQKIFKPTGAPSSQEDYIHKRCAFFHYIGECGIEEAVFAGGGYEGKNIMNNCMQAMNLSYETWSQSHPLDYTEAVWFNDIHVYAIAQLPELKWWT